MELRDCRGGKEGGRGSDGNLVMGRRRWGSGRGVGGGGGAGMGELGSLPSQSVASVRKSKAVCAERSIKSLWLGLCLGQH